VWHSAIERGLSPIAAGLILAGGLAVLRVSPGGWPVWIAATLSTAVILSWPRLHPLVLFAAGGALFGLAATIGLW
jgi:chromate transporter